MGKKSRLTKLYNALATMRRESLQTSFELAELINKINGDIYAANPEKKPEKIDFNDPGNDDLPLSTRLKWALIALHRAQRELEDYKTIETENQQLKTELAEIQQRYDKLKLRYDEKSIQATKIQSEEGQSQLKNLINKNLNLQKELNKQYEIVKKLTNMLEQQNKNSKHPLA